MKPSCKRSLVYHDNCIHAECWMNLWQMSNWGNKGISIAENARRQIYIIHNNTEQWRAQHALYINENWIMHNQKEHILSYPVMQMVQDYTLTSFISAPRKGITSLNWHIWPWSPTYSPPTSSFPTSSFPTSSTSYLQPFLQPAYSWK